MPNREPSSQAWNKAAQVYQTKFMELAIYNHTYDAFCAALPKDGGQIMELGCGPGNITKYVQEVLPTYDLTALDASENMLALAKENVPSAHFLCTDCRKIVDFTKKYDGLICGFVLNYLSNGECEQLTENAKNLLVENGILYLSFVAGDPQMSGYISGSVGRRTYFNYHELEVVKSYLTKNNFAVLEEFSVDYVKAPDASEMHTVLLMKKVG